MSQAVDYSSAIVTKPAKGSPAGVLYASAEWRTDPGRAARGLDCAQNRQVTESTISRGSIEAWVEGSRGSVYEVDIKAPSLQAAVSPRKETTQIDLEGSCSCYDYLGNGDSTWCKHLLAVVYTVGTSFATNERSAKIFYGPAVSSLAISQDQKSRKPTKRSVRKAAKPPVQVAAVDPSELVEVLATLQTPLPTYTLEQCFAQAEQILLAPPALTRLLALPPPAKVKRAAPKRATGRKSR
jgi:hypothetical protein